MFNLTERNNKPYEVYYEEVQKAAARGKEQSDR